MKCKHCDHKIIYVHVISFEGERDAYYPMCDSKHYAEPGDKKKEAGK